VSQQLREAFPYDTAPNYLIHDRDSIFNTEVVETMKVVGLKSVRTTFKSPWQIGIAERFVGSCRRDLLDHVIVLNERHLKRLVTEYVRYYHEDRTHLGLDKRTPAGRKSATGTTANAKVISMLRLGDLHHRYDLAAQGFAMQSPRSCTKTPSAAACSLRQHCAVCRLYPTSLERPISLFIFPLPACPRFSSMLAVKNRPSCLRMEFLRETPPSPCRFRISGSVAHPSQNRSL
jgi:hypothetical protein